MKFKVYEIKAIHFNGVGNLEKSFLCADYVDAVKKFKELIKEAKNVDWITEGLKSDNDKYKLINKVDHWNFSFNGTLESKSYDISIKEREVY